MIAVLDNSPAAVLAEIERLLRAPDEFEPVFEGTLPASPGRLTSQRSVNGVRWSGNQSSLSWECYGDPLCAILHHGRLLWRCARASAGDGGLLLERSP